LWKLSSKKRFPRGMGVGRGRAAAAAVLGSIYAVWLIYAADVQYLIMGSALLLLGVPVYIIARKQKKNS